MFLPTSTSLCERGNKKGASLFMYELKDTQHCDDITSRNTSAALVKQALEESKGVLTSQLAWITFSERNGVQRLQITLLLAVRLGHKLDVSFQLTEWYASLSGVTRWLAKAGLGTFSMIPAILPCQFLRIGIFCIYAY
jgi:hypothetical protein